MDHSYDARSRDSFFDRLRPGQILKWVAYVLAAAGVAGGVAYWTSIPGRAQHSYEEAQRYYQTGRYPNALYEVNNALRGRGLRLQSYLLRANIYRALQEPEKAAGDMSRVIEMEPGVVEHYAFRASSFLDMGDMTRAIRDYTKITELRRTGQSFADRGRAYMKAKDPTKAIEDFTTAISLEPTLGNYLERGQAYAALDNHEKAMADFNSALETTPDYEMSAVYGYRARAAERRRVGDTAGGDDDLEKAKQLEARMQLAPVRTLTMEAEVTADRAKSDADKKEEAAVKAARDAAAKPARQAHRRRVRAH